MRAERLVMKKFFVVGLLLILVIPTISKAQQSVTDVDKAPLAIRIENATDRKFDSVLVNFSGQKEVYESLEPGKMSPYRAVTKAYRYAYVEIKLGEERFVLQPIDFFGERLLKPGKYTYRLTIVPDRNSHPVAFLKLIEDKE